MRTRARSICRGALLIVALAAPALAGDLRGHGLVVAKDVARRTVTLDGERKLRLTERSVIEGHDGGRITLAELGVAEAVGGGFAASADASVEFEGRRLGREIVVERLQVLPGPVE